MELKVQSGRKYWQDYLRVFACAAIVLLHVISNRLGDAEVLTQSWCILAGLLVLTRFAVPVFVMLSGSNLLGRDKEYHLAKKHSLNLFVKTVLWCVIYLVADYLIDMIVGKDLSGYTLEYFSSTFAQGNAYIFWFCFMLVGLYLMIPVLNPIVRSKKNCSYLLGCCLFATIVLPMLDNLLGGGNSST